MRIVIVGASDVGVMVAKILQSRNHDIVIVEQSREVIEALYDELDCSFIHGDGTRPAILQEAELDAADALFCVTESDQSNIIASLVGRTLGARRVVTKIEKPEFESICLKLGLEHTIVPPRTIARYLADMLNDVDVVELSTYIRGEARFFMFMATDREDGKSVSDLNLPAQARVVCFYRDGEFHLAEEGSTVQRGDEVVVLTHARNLVELNERFRPDTASEYDAEA